jgi:hypothetical protein
VEIAMNIVMRDRLIAAAVLAAVVGGVVWYEKSKSPSTSSNLLTKGHVYQFSMPIATTPDDAKLTASAVMTDGPIWQNVSMTAAGGRLVVRGTYVGPDGVPIGNLSQVG